MKRHATRAAALALSAIPAAAALGFTTTGTAAVALASATGATALIMGGTEHPLSTPPDTVDYVRQYLRVAVDNYIAPASTVNGIPGGPYNAVAVITPEQFAPDPGPLTFDQSVAEGVVALDHCLTGAHCVYNPAVGSSDPQPGDRFVVFGFSQSATIATLEKRDLAGRYGPGEGPDVSFVLVSNGNRPNGGFLARGREGFTIPFPLTFGGATFSGPTPTDTGYATVDIARQYDGWADFPVNPLNLLAVANAMQGITTLHTSTPGYAAISLDDPSLINQGTYGDTTYYLAPTGILPLLMPLEQVPVIGYAAADTLDPPLRVLVEAGYDRSVSPGQPTGWNPLYTPDPVKLAADVAAAIPAGADNGMQDLFGVRPLGTERPGPFGVGGGDAGGESPTAATVSAPRTATGLPTKTAKPAVRPAASASARPAASRAPRVTHSDGADRAADRPQRGRAIGR